MTGTVRLGDGVDPVVAQPLGPARGRLPAARLGGDVRLCRGRAALAVLDPLADRGAVAVTPAVEAAVVGEQLRAEHVEEVVSDVEGRVRRRRLDELDAEAATRVESGVESLRDVRVELDGSDPRRQGHTDAGEGPRPAARRERLRR